MKNNLVSLKRIGWLQQLLRERFRLSLRLRSLDLNFWEISLPGSGKKIVLPRCDSKFPIGDSDTPFVLWEISNQPLKLESKKNIPAPGWHSASPLLFSQENGIWHFRYDVLGLAWWMLSRAEEVGRQDLDEFSRFPAENSHAARHDYLDRPIVDEWLMLLAKAMEIVWPSLTIPQRTFSISLSHDVDRPSRYAFAGPLTALKRSVADMARTRSVSHFLRSLWLAMPNRNKLRESDPYNTFSWIMSQSERLGVQSTFYFLSGKTNPTYDADYDLGHPSIRNLLRDIHSRGHRIGLHPSFDSFLSLKALRDELATLRFVCKEEQIDLKDMACRMHYLRISVPTTLRYLALLGFDNDSTLGYAERPGFRCGTCHEFQAFDAQANQGLPIRIRPLTAMDVSIFLPQYLGPGNSERAYSLVRKLREECRLVGGEFSLLWHNSELVSAQKKRFYKDIISGA